MNGVFFCLIYLVIGCLFLRKKCDNDYSEIKVDFFYVKLVIGNMDI